VFLFFFNRCKYLNLNRNLFHIFLSPQLNIIARCYGTDFGLLKRNYDLKVANKSSENMTGLKKLGTVLNI
jgi:hypothetical protein